MSIVLNKDVVFRCSVDKILHPTKEEEKKRIDKSSEAWTMFRTYIKNGTHYEPRLCVGMAPPVSEGDELTLIGDLIEDERYGIQFQFSCIQKYIPIERNGIISFLVKNVNGIGPKMAEKIVDVLGTDVVEKIRNTPSVLETVSGISAKRADSIKNQLDAMGDSLEDLQFFAKTGLGNARVNAIKSAYAEISKERRKKIDVIQLIKKNPYQMMADVKGIGFKVADMVALNIGFPKDSPDRISAGINFCLKEDVDAKGNIWIDKEGLLKEASGAGCLNLSIPTIRPVLEDMLSKGLLTEECDRIYLPYFYDLEFAIAQKMQFIMAYKADPISDDVIEKGIDRAQKEKGRTLDDGQKNAVVLCIKNNLAIITGGPGVGKTTTLDILLSFLENECGMNITMAAPTGRAAKRMTEQTGRKAFTIHALSAKMTREDFTIGTKRQVLVIDESSMVDMNTLKMIMDLCDVSTKLIFVGDVDQLPSIGPGQVLRDMIESGVVPTARLTKIHRQSEDSHIITNAHLVINGKHTEKDGATDFFIAERNSEEECLASIKNYITNVYPKKLGVPSSEIQVLVPLRKGALGVNNLNKVLQDAINPSDISKKEIQFSIADDRFLLREGDRVIQNKNDYRIEHDDDDDLGVFNGEIGIIKEISNDFGEISIRIQFPDKCAVYDMTSIRNVSLAYAISIHKSQGSEFKAVVMMLYKYGVPTIYNRNLLYTAITRAKSYCCIIGQRDTVNKMIHNNKINKRHTTLASRLNGGNPCVTLASTKKKRKTSKKI